MEGANLFFTDEARLKLESNGVILFKDASANKGGVTSSSMEVFAALCAEDSVHSELLTVPKDETTAPRTYTRYVEDIIALIKVRPRLV